ncbi:MAG: ATP-dependent helicase [Cyanobacteria bacterium P01_D01_bin.56]
MKCTRNHSVIAGPGAGKTELLAQRACYLLQTGSCHHQDRILAISCKKDSAKNLKERVDQRCHPDLAKRLDSLTFSAFAKGLVDRFNKAIPIHFQPSEEYEIYQSNHVRKAIPEFLVSLSNRSENTRIRNSLLTICRKNKFSVNRNYFEKSLVLGIPLPVSSSVIKRINKEREMYVNHYAAFAWWTTCLKVGNRCLLTFPMIERLAELILRANPFILNALRGTYSHVFLDEFQDTTHVQYSLVKTAFLQSHSVITAVGDDKQKIMGWAMAMDDAFERFEKDFDGIRIQLVRNYRSSNELVAIQHHLASSINPDCIKAVSHKERSIEGESCSIWEFNTLEEEASRVVSYIKERSQSSMSPRDFVILVKQKPDEYLKTLAPFFTSAGLNVRVESEIQDILSENLTTLLLTFLRFGATTTAGVFFLDCFKLLRHQRAVSSENGQEEKQLQRELCEFHSVLNESISRISDWKMSDSKEIRKEIRTLLNLIVNFLGTDNIANIHQEYKQKGSIERIVDKNEEYIAYYCADANYDLLSALDSFEGQDSIPIMTVHKSKGLEFHTVIYIGLDDKAWWSIKKQPEESLSVFFVAFSRAKERVIITYCKQRGARKDVSSFYDMLTGAGVKAVLNHDSKKSVGNFESSLSM